ncbi:MAG: hypothetical protein ABIA37_02020 [Candidatus Woesearchaeota archaeon]
MKKIILLSVLILGLFLVSCNQVAEKSMEQQIESQTGADADVDIKGDTTTVTTNKGDTTVTSTVKNADDWCQVGSEWKLASTGKETGNAEWKVQGIMNSGEFKGLCHITYRAESNRETMAFDYYVDESGENGYMEMNVNGQKYTSQWSAEQ